MREIDYRLTKADYRDFYLRSSARRLWKFGLLVGVLLTGLNAWSDYCRCGDLSLNDLLREAGWGFGFAAAVCFAVLLLNTWSAAKIYDAMEPIAKEQTLSWDENGMLFFHGRMTDSVRCKGENVSAFEVESVAGRHPDVLDAAMVGVPAEIGEHDIQLFIQPRAGTNPDPADIWTWMAGQLAPHQRPRYIALMADFPRTPSQRIQKHLLPKQPDGRWEAPRGSGNSTKKEAAQ